MKTRFVVWTGLVLVVALQFIVRPVAQDAGVRALYDRAESLNRRTQNLIFNVAETPQWVQGAPTLFTYRRSVKGGNEFVLVDSAAKSKAPAFDHAKLAASLSTAAGAKYTAITLPFNTFTFVDNRQAIEFAVGAGGAGRQGGGAGAGRQGGGGPAAPRWRCTLTDYTCTRAAASPADQAGAPGAGQGRAGGQGAGRGAGAGAGANAT